MLEATVLFVLGLVVLTAGAEAIVRGAARLADILGLSPLFMGLTLVAFGTSTPELVVSVVAAVEGMPGVALGNAVGSNIFNSGVVLGVSALIATFPCRARVVQRQALLVMLATALLAFLAWDGMVTRLEAAVLLVGFVAQTVWSYRLDRRASPEGGGGQRLDSPARGRRRWPLYALLALSGLALLALGGGWVVSGASEIARAMGVSRTVIALTVVAAGTSLPELATSAVAAARGETNIAVGNVLGSNLFNLLAIVGVSGTLRPLAVEPRIIGFDIPAALLFAIACIPIGLTGGRISRAEGTLLSLGYLAYITLVLAALSSGTV